MFGKLGNMMGNIKDAQRKIEEAKEGLNNISVTETSSDHKIAITITASREIKDIKIDSSLLHDSDELEDHLVLTINKAIQKANEMNEAEMKNAASGMMDMPGMDKLFQ